MRVVETIEILLDDYRTDTGKKPAGILVGPQEYVQLCDYVIRKKSTLKNTLVFGTLVTEFLGYPVYVKELPGVELMIPYTDIARYL